MSASTEQDSGSSDARNRGTEALAPHPGWEAALVEAAKGARTRRVTAVIGDPGTGKSLLLVRLRAELEEAGLSVALLRDARWDQLAAVDVLLLDAAERLSPDELRALCAQAPSCVAAGRPDLALHFAELRDEPAVVLLPTLTAEQTGGFFRALTLRDFGPGAEVHDDAVAAMVEHSAGVPRSVTILAGLAAFAAGLEDSEHILARHVEAAVRLRSGSEEEEAADVAPPRSEPPPFFSIFDAPAEVIAPEPSQAVRVAPRKSRRGVRAAAACLLAGSAAAGVAFVGPRLVVRPEPPSAAPAPAQVAAAVEPTLAPRAAEWRLAPPEIAPAPELSPAPSGPVRAASQVAAEPTPFVKPAPPEPAASVQVTAAAPTPFVKPAPPAPAASVQVAAAAPTPFVKPAPPAPAASVQVTAEPTPFVKPAPPVAAASIQGAAAAPTPFVKPAPPGPPASIRVTAEQMPLLKPAPPPAASVQVAGELQTVATPAPAAAVRAAAPAQPATANPAPPPAAAAVQAAAEPKPQPVVKPASPAPAAPVQVAAEPQAARPAEPPATAKQRASQAEADQPHAAPPGPPRGLALAALPALAAYHVVVTYPGADKAAERESGSFAALLASRGVVVDPPRARLDAAERGVLFYFAEDAGPAEVVAGELDSTARPARRGARLGREEPLPGTIEVALPLKP
jgi:hypothetical protein